MISDSDACNNFLMQNGANRNEVTNQKHKSKSVSIY